MRTRSIATHIVTVQVLLLAACATPPIDTDTTTSDVPAGTVSSVLDRPDALLHITEPFDANEHASRHRFATQIAHATVAPAWLGATPLEERLRDGEGRYVTPDELVDRRLITHSDLPVPSTDTFVATVDDVTQPILARSTWHDACPVTPDDLAYVTVTFYGFDQVTHTGELLVHRDVADDVITVFARLFDVKFPIEAMRIIRQDELDADPTGDGNITTGFVCRSVTSGTSWSEHAYGRAIDINPFHNPYLRGSRVVPELATAYLDRTNIRPGMIRAGDEVVDAFAAIGWSWGGNWVSAKDWMHFSSTGR